jgi:hypothetical protein
VKLHTLGWLAALMVGVYGLVFVGTFFALGNFLQDTGDVS